ncbi:MAG: divalent cation transporter [Candidatus Altiarchaeales archaeon]|nr:divalent cation transporter [Candidatus Altiarchaeales archaeon]
MGERLFIRILRESLPVLTLCSIGGIAAGLLLESLKTELNQIPGLIILLPAILGMRGNISAALGSRLASALHLGLIEARLSWNQTLSDNFYSSILLNFLLSALTGILAWIAYSLTGASPAASIPQLTLIAVIAGTLAGIILTLLTVSLAIYTYASGYDPDNVLSPSIATVGDVATVFCLLLAVKLVV